MREQWEIKFGCAYEIGFSSTPNTKFDTLTPSITYVKYAINHCNHCIESSDQVNKFFKKILHI
jgi:hypothetical protein